MRLNMLFAAAAIAAMTAGAAAAQTAAAPGGPDAAPAPMNSDATAPSASQNGMPAAATTNNVVLESSPTPAASAYTLKAGDPNVISNGPVPDTPANRAHYGKPMSNAGRHTTPAGN